MRKVKYSTNKKEWSPSLLPGPISLISTCNAAKAPNVAPKSWLQMVSIDPPILMLSTSKETTTAKNIIATRCFTVNIVDSAMAEKAFQCVKWFGPERINKMGINLVPADRIAAPLVEQCPAHLECVLYKTKQIGNAIVVFGKIVAASIREDVLSAPPAERYKLLDQILFLENDLYTPISGVRSCR